MMQSEEKLTAGEWHRIMENKTVGLHCKSGQFQQRAAFSVWSCCGLVQVPEGGGVMGSMLWLCCGLVQVPEGEGFMGSML